MKCFDTPQLNGGISGGSVEIHNDFLKYMISHKFDVVSYLQVEKDHTTFLSIFSVCVR